MQLNSIFDIMTWYNFMYRIRMQVVIKKFSNEGIKYWKLCSKTQITHVYHSVHDYKGFGDKLCFLLSQKPYQGLGDI